MRSAHTTIVHRAAGVAFAAMLTLGLGASAMAAAPAPSGPRAPAAAGCEAGLAEQRSVGTASRALAGGWGTRKVVDLTGDQTARLEVTGDESAVVIYTSAHATWIKRTTNGGTSFGSPARISPSGRTIFGVAVGGLGKHLDVISESSAPFRDLYRHSGDGGKTWGATVSMTSLGGAAQIARGSHGLVAYIALADDLKYRVRVSTNGGASFHAAVKVGDWHPCGDFQAGPDVAISGGVIIVLFTDQDGNRVTRRSTDHGTSWSTRHVLASAGWAVDDLAVHGETVIALYDKPSTRLALRRSTDRGKTWSAEVPFGLSAAGGAVAWADGTWRIASTDTVDTWRYRASANGLTWSSPTVIRTGGGDIGRPIGVGALGGGPVAAFLDGDIFLSTH